MQNQITEKVITVKQKIRELDKTQKEVLNRMASYGRSGYSILTAASKEISQLEEHVRRVDSKSVEYANNLNTVTKQISDLLLKTSKLNVLVDKLQKTVHFGERYRKVCSNDLPNNNEYSECSLIEIETNESKVEPLTHNAIQCFDSNINPCKPFGKISETKFFEQLETCRDKDNAENSSTKRTSSDEIFLDENKIEEDNPFNASKKEKVNDSGSEIDNCNTSNRKTKIRKNESGYRSRTREIQNDNRISFYNICKSSGGGGHIKENVSRTDIQREDSNVSDIKPTEHITEDTRTMMKSVTSYRSSRRLPRRGNDEDIYDERHFDSGQHKTVREWYQYTKQMKAYASARMRSGAVKLSRSHNVILVLDISERMTSYFQKLKSAALQYVYGIKQNSECSDLENGIGIAVFGRETRLIQEATSDYELVIDLI
ncbi:Hypothetical predicted protein, partial [Mytilus galloprovincialis]